VRATPVSPRPDGMGRPCALLALLVIALSGCAITPPRAREHVPPGDGSMDAVVRRAFTVYGVRLESGRVLPELTLAFETYGRLAPDGRNAILVTHGFTSGPHAAGRYAPTNLRPGWWNGLIGPGKAIDTDRYFVVSSNMLGSSFGSTGPPSINPATGMPYGPDFPTITLRDIVDAQRMLLSGLGVRHLVAVAGPSFGGYQAFQWAVSYPTFMDGVVAVVTAPKGGGGERAVARLERRLASDPNWNGGWHYRNGGMFDTMTAIRTATLRRYGIDAVLVASIGDAARREARLHDMAARWARRFDPNSLVTLRRAAVHFDAERDFPAIRARVLYVLSRTDRLFPPGIAPGVMDRLHAAGVQATYVEIDSEFGHLASGTDWAKWAPTLREFLRGLDR
jgi:homoserine O-acetyltransferase